jgi:hypothetical protein
MTTNKTNRLVRPAEAWSRLGCKKSKFYEDFIRTGRVKLRRLGPKSVAVLESDLEALIESLPVVEMPAARERIEDRSTRTASKSPLKRNDGPSSETRGPAIKAKPGQQGGRRG